MSSIFFEFMYNFWLLENSVAELHSSMWGREKRENNPNQKKPTKPEQNKNSPAFEFPVWSFPWMACRYWTKKWINTPPHFLHNVPDSVLLCYIHHRHVFSFSRGFIPLIIFVIFSLPSLVIQRFQKECDQNWTHYSRINTMNEVPGYKDNLE